MLGQPRKMGMSREVGGTHERIYAWTLLRVYTSRERQGTGDGPSFRLTAGGAGRSMAGLLEWMTEPNDKELRWKQYFRPR